MVSRARERVRQDRKRFDVPVATRVNLLRRFTAAFEAGDEATLLAIFCAASLASASFMPGKEPIVMRCSFPSFR